MDTLPIVNRPPCGRRQSGISLIIVMIMVVIIGLTSAAAIRNATSGERATNNIRLQSLAQQYAEAALRYCEAELTKADADRVATLRNANIVQTAFAADPPTPQAWENPVTWTGAAGSGGASSSRTVVPEAQIKSGNSSLTPTTRPQCVAERQVMADGGIALVLTARGFSPGYTADAVSGVTTGGSVVWLQSILFLE
ncbi:MAG: pilus assembly PilX family protein [Burkholderiales bacterium]